MGVAGMAKSVITVAALRQAGIFVSWPCLETGRGDFMIL